MLTSMCSRNRPVSTRSPDSPEKGHCVLVQPLRLLRRRGAGEVGAAALAGVCVQRKLAYNEKLRPDIQGGAIKTVLVVGEEPEVQDLLCQVAGVLVPIICFDPQQDYQASTDPPRFHTRR